MRNLPFGRAFGAGLAFSIALSAPAFAEPAAAAGLVLTVQDALGRPVADAEVRLGSASGEPGAAGRTDASGRFEATVPAGRWAVAVSAPGFAPGELVVSLEAGGSASATLALQAAGTLELPVTAERLARPRTQVPTAIGAGVTHFDQEAVAALPRGENTPLNQVLLQAPGVAQDSEGQLHVRGDHGNLQYRLNGVMLPESFQAFGATLDTRFFDRVDLITGALPAQYGYRTAGVVELKSKTGLGLQGGTLSLFGGERQLLQPAVQVGGSLGGTDVYLAGSYLQSALGLENRTAEPDAVHDFTRQGQALGYASTPLGATARLMALAGTALQRYQIPTMPGGTPDYTVAGQAPIPSEALDANLAPSTQYGLLALQGAWGTTLDYQVAAFGRLSGLSYAPDAVGDLQYSGVSAAIDRSARLGGFQGDGTWRPAPGHAVRFGSMLTLEDVDIRNQAQVLPADADGKQTSDVPVTIVDDTAVAQQLFGLYAQDEWALLPNLTLNGGLRFDVQRGFTQDQELEPRLGLVYRPWSATTVHAGYARYFTPPSTELVTPTAVAKFAGTTGALPDRPAGSLLPLPEKAHYWDVGITHSPLPGLDLGLDAYYKDATALHDIGQFGRALVESIFNLGTGHVVGSELTAGYRSGPLASYLNVALSRAVGRGVLTGQVYFDDQELAQAQNQDIPLDHDQLLTASGGASYDLFGTRLSLAALAGSGLRRGELNSETMPFYTQVDLGASREFALPGFGPFTARLAVTNVLDVSYALRDDSGIGIQAPQYGPRRAFSLGLSKTF